jgi:hypothetical protein
LPLPTFLTAWTTPAGTVKASPALYVFGGWPSIWYSSDPSEDVDDLFARMGVLDQRRFGADVDARLDHLTSGDAEILLLEIGAPESRRLLDRYDPPFLLH